MDSEAFNSKLDFLNQIMENELTHNSNKDFNEEAANNGTSTNNNNELLNEENGTNANEDLEANNNQVNTYDLDADEEEEDGDENQSENSLNASMNAEDQSSLSFDDANQQQEENTANDTDNKEKPTLTEQNLNKSQAKKTKKNVKIITPANHNSIKSFLGTNNNLLYAIPTYSFSQFETMLFDLAGFAPISSFKVENIRPDEPEVSILKKIDELNAYEPSAAIIPDMSVLNENLTNNVFRKAKLKANETSKAPKMKPSLKQSIKNDDSKSKQIKSKVITVILNQPHDPTCKRKANRILLSRRNTSSMDAVLNEISNLFKVDSSNVRRLFSMDGNQVHNLNDLFELDLVFLVIGTEKTHSKDFHFEQEEIDKYFANELMKNIFSVKLAKLNEKKHEEQISTSQIDQKDLAENSDDIINYMPDELLNNYEIGEEIGYGHYALVRAVKDINTGYEFALKIVDLKKCAGKESMIENELDILRKIKHPNIVKLVEEYKTDDYLYIVMEYLKGGDLLEALTAREKYDEKEACILIQSLASAIGYLHENKIAHRDIKLENILVNKNSEGNLTAVKLGDFGLATKIDNGLLNQKCGSPVYVAPEVLLGKDYGFEVDIWSLGVIMYILLVGFAPFQGENDEATFELIKTGELAFLPPYWDDISENAKDLIRKMLDRNQETRLKAREVLQHKWISGIDETKENTKLRQMKSSESLLSNLTNSATNRTTKQPSANQVNKKLNEKLSNMSKVYKSSLVIPK